LRLLLLSPHPGVSGPLPKHTPLLIDALRAAGCDVTSVPWGRHSDTETRMTKIVERFRDIVGVRSLVSKNEKFEVMVVKTSLEWMSLLRDVPLLVSVRRRVPTLVVQFHGGHPDRLLPSGHRFFKAASRFLLRLSDGVLVLSSEEARGVSAFSPSTPVEVVVNPFLAREDEADDSAAAETAGIPTVLFAGRLVEEKGILDTVDAFALLRDRRPCRLLVAGRGPAAGEVAARLEARGLSDDATVAGQLSHADVTAAYRASDVFVLPTYWGEGFPTAIAEAMNAGLPIVTTKLRGMADHLVDGVNGIFVPPRAPAALAEAIERLLADDELRRRMASANKAKVRDFAPDAAAEIYLQALARITGAGARATTS